MSRGLKLWMLACAVAVAAVLFYDRFEPAPRERLDALRQLEATAPPVQGRDGADAALVLAHAVPLADRARVAAGRRAYVAERARRREAAWIAGDEAGKGAGIDRVPDPLARYPKRADAAKHRLACRPYVPGCLPHVHEDLPDTEALLREHAPLIEAARELPGFDGIRIASDADWNDVPSLSAGRALLLTAYATAFARGERQAALADMCRDLAGWRRIGADAQHPYVSLRASTFVRQDVHLLAQMVLELPPDASLPAPCDQALAPTTDAELSACGPARMEFQWLRATLAAPMPEGHAQSIAGAADPSILAPRYAHYCSRKALAAARRDRPMRKAPAPGARCRALDYLTRGPSCVVLRITPRVATDELARYADRRMDQAQQVALLRVVMWSRAHASHPREWGDLELPRSLGFRRTARFQNGLCFDQYDKTDFTRFCLPVFGRLNGEEARETAGTSTPAPTDPSPARR